MIPLWQVALKPQAVYNLDNIILYFVVHSGNVQQIGPTKIGLTTQERENQVKKKKAKVLPSDSNSPNKTDYPRETESGEKKAKVLPSDSNSPNRTDYPRETESGEKKSKGSAFR